MVLRHESQINPHLCLSSSIFRNTASTEVSPSCSSNFCVPPSAYTSLALGESACFWVGEEEGRLVSERARDRQLVTSTRHSVRAFFQALHAYPDNSGGLCLLVGWRRQREREVASKPRGEVLE